MNRTERLQALVDELRAASPEPRTTRWLAERFAVSQRTIERDAAALAAAGTPVYAAAGPQRGYAVDSGRELPPVALTADEAVTVAVGLSRLAGTAFTGTADAILAKLHARFPGLTASAAMAVAEVAEATGIDQFPPVPVVLQEALRGERVLDIDYADRRGAISHRTVEPIGVVGTGEHWLLLAWCRMRHGIRGFRIDRIRSARMGTERVRARRDLSGLDLPAIGLRAAG